MYLEDKYISIQKFGVCKKKSFFFYFFLLLLKAVVLLNIPVDSLMNTTFKRITFEI